MSSTKTLPALKNPDAMAPSTAILKLVELFDASVILYFNGVTVGSTPQNPIMT